MRLDTNTKSRWRLDGKLAMITGATKGIGRAVAEEFAEHGASLILVARHSPELESMVENLLTRGVQAEAHVCDVSDKEARKRLIQTLRDRYSSLDILVNNVGTNIRKKTVEYSDEEYRLLFETNLHSAFEFCKSLHELLRNSGEASIVNIASTNGLLYSRTGAPYSMTKAAMIHMSRYFAVEWASDGIRVNAVAPWYIETPLTKGVLSDERYRNEVLERTPMKRIGKSEEVAAAVLFFCLPAASYISGQCLAVDGGFTVYGF